MSYPVPVTGLVCLCGDNGKKDKNYSYCGKIFNENLPQIIKRFIAVYCT